MGDFTQRVRLPLYILRHPANEGRRLQALGRAASFQVRSRLSGKPTIATVGNQRMWVNVGSASATKVVYGSPPDWPEMQAWKRLLHPGELFIDVGANIGAYSLWAADLGARVIAIEPDPTAAERLRANLALNPGIDVEVVEAAASTVDGITSLTTGLDSKNHLGEGQEVTAVTLDRVASASASIAGIKIDVEGAERLVLQGSMQLLRRRAVRVFQIEWNSASEALLGEDRGAVRSLLEKHGYRLFRADAHGELIPTYAAGYGPDVFAVAPASTR